MPASDRQISPCYREKSVSRKGEHCRCHFPPLAFKSRRVSLEDLAAVPCECDWTQSLQRKRAFRTPQTFCICGFHPHSDPEDRRAEIRPKRDSKPSCRRASPWAHTQYILIKELSLGPENFWILMHLKLIQPAQTQTCCKLRYSPHDPHSQAERSFPYNLKIKSIFEEINNNILTSFSN